MELSPKHVVVPVLVMLTALALLGLRTAAATSCADANAQLEKGAVAEAEKQLTAILRSEPKSECAADALDKLARDRCAEADDARESRLFKQALAGYKAALATRPVEECARAGVRKTVAALCERAAILKDRGAGEAAKKAYTAILEIEPLESPDCAASGLAEPTKDGDAIPGAPEAPGKDGRG